MLERKFKTMFDEKLNAMILQLVPIPTEILSVFFAWTKDKVKTSIVNRLLFCELLTVDHFTDTQCFTAQ